MANPQNAGVSVTLDGKQAEIELKKLSEESARLRAAILKAKKTGDFEGLVKAQDDLKKVNAQVKAVDRSTRIYNTVLKNLSTASVSELERAHKELSREVKNTTRNTEEYVAKSKMLRQVSAELGRVRAESNALTASKKSFFSTAADGFNKYFGFVTTMVASLTGLVFSFRQTVQAFNDFEEAGAELSSITGLAGEDLEFLKNKAKELSVSVSEDGVRIKSSAQDILAAFTLMGSAKPELLKNKEALAEVTKEALILAEAAKMNAKDAVDALANTMNQFGAPADEARRYINALAAGSKEGAVMITDLSNSMVKAGTVASQANISVEETVALLETLGDRGIRGEVAGTQLRGVLLKLQTGAKEFNPAIVGMSTALDNLAAANLSVSDQVKIFGQENVVAAQILVSSRDRYKELTAAVTGTNVAIAQAAINTDTANAKLEQARNKVQLNAIALGERLSPALTFSTNAFNELLAVLIRFIDWAERNRQSIALFARALSVLLATIGSYIATVKTVNLLNKIWTVSQVVLKNGAIALKGVYALLTGNIQKATAAQKALNMAQAANPWGLVIAGITAAASALLIFAESSDEAAGAQADLAEKIGNVNNLLREQKSLMGETEEIIGQIATGQVDLSKRSIPELEDALTDLNDRLRAMTINDFMMSLNLDISADELKKQAEERYKQEVETLKRTESIIKKEILLRKAKNKIVAEGDADESKGRKKTAEDILKLLRDYQKKVTDQITALENEKRTANERELDQIRQKYNEELLIAEQAREKDTKNREEWEKVIEQLVLNRNEELNRKRDEQEKRWQRSLFEAKKEAGKLNDAELMQDELDRLQERYLAEEISFAEFLIRKLAIEEKYENERAAKIKAARDKYGLIDSAEKMQDELNELKKAYADRLLTDEEFARAQANIFKKYADERRKADEDAWKAQIKTYEGYFQNAQVLVNAFANFFAEAKEYELQAAGDNEEKKKQINKKYADIEMGVKIAQIIASTALAIMQGFAQLGPIGGAVAAAVVGATGGVQIASAVRQRNLIRGFEEGYYGDVTDHRGRRYKARAGGYPRTQMVDKPTVFLAGEQGRAFPEMIIDGPTFRNLQVNAPEAIDAIYAARDGIRGFEEGYYPGRETIVRETNTQTMFTDPELKALLKYLLIEGVQAKVVYRDIKEVEDKENRIRTTFGAK